MSIIKVCPVHYRIKGTNVYKKGIQILNKRTNTFKLVDCRTLKDVPVGETDTYITLEQTYGNIIFNITK